MALLPRLAKPRFPVLANERVIPAAPTWVGGVHSCSTPEGAHPATRTMKASLSSSPGALLSCVFPSSGLTCTAPPSPGQVEQLDCSPRPHLPTSASSVCAQPGVLCLVVVHVTRGPIESAASFPHYLPHYLSSSGCQNTLPSRRMTHSFALL